MCAAQLEGDTKKALRLHYRMQPLNRAMFLETNPMPVKTALAMMGLVKEEFRLPLVKMSGDKRRLLRGVLKSYGVIT
jgi:4-hydroxy-tetrahydrodipicolinate synthase